MNKSLNLLFLLLLFLACAKDDIAPTDSVDEIQFRGTGHLNICHISDDDTWHVLSVNANALNAHLNHGDVLLVDADGDGWVEAENECVPGGDCDDNDATVFPGAEEICGDGIDNNCDGAIDEGCLTPCWEGVIDQLDLESGNYRIQVAEAPLPFPLSLAAFITNEDCVPVEEENSIILIGVIFDPEVVSCSYKINDMTGGADFTFEEGLILQDLLIQYAADNNIPDTPDSCAGALVNESEDKEVLLQRILSKLDPEVAEKIKHYKKN